MKRIIVFIAIIAASVLAVTACASGPQFSASVDKEQVLLSADKADVVGFVASDYSGAVTASINGSAAGVTVKTDFDTTTGKGKITFATTLTEKASYDVNLVLSDGKSSEFFKMNISVAKKNVWSIEPEDPVIAQE